METSASEANELLQGYKEAVDFSSIVTKTDLLGRITYANNNFCKISGYSRDELIGQHHNIVRHPDQSSDSFKDMWDTIKSKQPWKGVVKNRHKDGSSYYVHATVVPFLDDNSEIAEYISIRQDITELYNLTNHLEERVAQEVEKNQKKEHDLLENLNIFLDSTPNPIIVMADDKIEFVNKAFLNLIAKDREELLYQKCILADILIEAKGYVSKQEKFVLNKENKIAIRTEHGRNIFNLYYEKIESFNHKSLKMYTLNNITKTEFQKMKIGRYNRQLQEYYFRHKHLRFVEDRNRSHGIKESVEKESVKEESIEIVSNKQTRELSDEEKKLLKRKHDDVAVSSKEYNEELDEYTLTEIQELDEIEYEIHDLISELQDKKQDSLHKIVLRLLKFATVLNKLMEFKELSFSISSLSDLLDKQNIVELDESTYKKMLLFLENITIDLSSWRRIVFIEQSANDIHYMDSSLFSSILQLELIFNTDQEHENEDDFELF